MRILATVALSFIAICASLVLVLSSLCAVSGGVVNSGDRSSYIFYAVVSLAVVTCAMWAIRKLKRGPNDL